MTLTVLTGRSQRMGIDVYEKPSFESEEIFETLATGCNLADTGETECSPGAKGGPLNTSL
jgi:hypothetical protein